MQFDFSWEIISDSNCIVTFTDKLCIVQDRITRTPIGLGEFRNGVYFFKPVTQVFSGAATVDTGLLIHQRLGHPSSQIMSSIYQLLNFVH